MTAPASTIFGGDDHAGGGLRVVVSVLGKFHSFDLARELHARGALLAIFSGYPRFKLRDEGVPQHSIHTFPYLRAPYMAMPRLDLLGRWVVRQWEQLDRLSLDSYVARNLPDCDVFVGLSGSSLRSGRLAKRRGASYVCDRGSSHIRMQERLLREEHQRWDMPYWGIDPRVIAREEAEYDEADCITVPSSFAWRSFIEQGVPAGKLRQLPYGVSLSRFEPVQTPATDRFDVLFVGGMSLRKGVPYLLQAYRQLQHPRKSITFAGAPSPALIRMLRKRRLWDDDARVLGHVPQAKLKHLMSRSHVMVLPSIEEGFGLVQAQSMACRCPVIGTPHSGAEDLYTDGHGGCIVPIRDAEALAERLQWLADHPDERAAIGDRALACVQRSGGWRDYGEQALNIYRELAR